MANASSGATSSRAGSALSTWWRREKSPTFAASTFPTLSNRTKSEKQEVVVQAFVVFPARNLSAPQHATFPTTSVRPSSPLWCMSSVPSAVRHFCTGSKPVSRIYDCRRWRKLHFSLARSAFAASIVWRGPRFATLSSFPWRLRGARSSRFEKARTWRPNSSGRMCMSRNLCSTEDFIGLNLSLWSITCILQLRRVKAGEYTW